MSSDKKYWFVITIDDSLSSFVHCRLYNGFDEVVAQAYGKLGLLIPKGLYRLRMEFNEQITEKDYRVDKDITDVLKIPGSYSAIPNKQFDSSHEYYSENSVEWSKKSTITNQKIAAGSSLFIFFRHSNADATTSSASIHKSLSKNFHLLDRNRKKTYSLEPGNVKEDMQMGWMAFTEALENGVYFLLFTGDEPREIPLYVYKDWQTQVFIIFSDGPIFSTTRILLAEAGTGFDMNDPISLHIDAILQKMYNGIFFVPPNLILTTAERKWDNPMLGIIVSYAYLLSDEKKYDDLFKIILENLQNNILHNTDSPDLMALQILAAEHFNADISPLPIEFPCMVLAGMKAFMRYSIQNPQFIKQGGIAEETIGKLKLDCVWTSYEPLDNFTSQSNSIKEIDKITTKSVGEKSIDEIEPNLNIQAKKIETQDWITLSIFNQLAYIDPHDPDTNKPSIHDIAAQFRLTPKIVEQHIHRIPTIDSALMNFTDKYLKGTPIDKEKIMENIKVNIFHLSQK